MLVIGFFSISLGIGLFCWLIFTLAVYALPFFVGMTVGMMALHSGAGVVRRLRCWHCRRRFRHSSSVRPLSP